MCVYVYVYVCVCFLYQFLIFWKNNFYVRYKTFFYIWLKFQ